MGKILEYEKCLVELNEILKHLKDEDVEKIPYEIRKSIEKEKDNKYNWSYDESKSLDEQNINRKTIAMLSYLNMEYLLNKEQKKLMEEFHRSNEKMNEKENFQKNIKNLDKKEKINDFNHENKVKENYSNVQMVIKKEEKWYKKVFKAIIAFFTEK